MACPLLHVDHPERLLEKLLHHDNSMKIPSCRVFSEIQNVFGQLLDSQLQYYQPDQLWHVFKLWGQSVNVREQQVSDMSFLVSD